MQKYQTKNENFEQSCSAEKAKTGIFCYGMGLHIMLEALDAFKIKYGEFIVKTPHSAQKVDHSE